MSRNRNDYDCSGWVTKYNIRCSDGRTIIPNAFSDINGKTVPVIWNHNHSATNAVVGNAYLEHRDGQGVYGYLSFNNTSSGKDAKEMVKHGDVKAMSIMANELRQNGDSVMHGAIREVSLVLAGANPGARIENVMVHSADGSVYEDDEQALIFTGFDTEGFTHNDKLETIDTEDTNMTIEHADNTSEKETPNISDGKTIQDVIDSMTKEQKDVLYYLVGAAAEGAGSEDDTEGEKDDMKHNAFENNYTEDYNENNDTARAEELMHAALADAKIYGSLKESCLQHGIVGMNADGDNYAAGKADSAKNNLSEYLFPDYKNIDGIPPFISRPMEWVNIVLNGCRHSPFSKIKSMFANITEEDARALGYIKGKQKKEEFFKLIKRTTDPQTIYKLQKMDRDDIIDITDFNVVTWIKGEMRMMLNEELARAILVGDGREPGDDKIEETHIRPIATDEELYTIQVTIDKATATTNDKIAKEFIVQSIKARKDYRGSGSPTLFTTEEWLTEMMLLEDSTGRVIYDTQEKLRNMLRVSSIVTVPVMEKAKSKSTIADSTVIGVIVNLSDYNIGADKGGAVSLFDDFDLNYNKMEYLIETRCSGALIRPYSAITINLKNAAG